MKHIKALIVILLVLLVVILGIENIPSLMTPVEFKIDLWKIYKNQSPNIPLGLVLVVAFLIGVLSMAVCGIAERFRLKKQIKTLLAEAKEREKELASLRNLPVTTGTVTPGKTYDTE